MCTAHEGNFVNPPIGTKIARQIKTKNSSSPLLRLWLPSRSNLRRTQETLPPATTLAGKPATCPAKECSRYDCDRPAVGNRRLHLPFLSHLYFSPLFRSTNLQLNPYPNPSLLQFGNHSFISTTSSMNSHRS